jgi:hypothetical protein
MFHEGYTVDRIHDLTKIDKWFLHKLMNIVECTKELEEIGSLFGLKKDIILKAKKLGFSDKQIAKAVGSTENEVRARRKSFGIKPWVKKIDTLAAEFPADTNYLASKLASFILCMLTLCSTLPTTLLLTTSLSMTMVCSFLEAVSTASEALLSSIGVLSMLLVRSMRSERRLS